MLAPMAGELLLATANPNIACHRIPSKEMVHLQPRKQMDLSLPLVFALLTVIPLI